MFNSANDIPDLPSLGRAANGRCQALPWVGTRPLECRPRVHHTARLQRWYRKKREMIFLPENGQEYLRIIPLKHQNHHNSPIHPCVFQGCSRSCEVPKNFMVDSGGFQWNFQAVTKINEINDLQHSRPNIWLVVDLPLWKIWVSWDYDIPNIWKVIRVMFQTTNQI